MLQVWAVFYKFYHLFTYGGSDSFEFLGEIKTLGTVFSFSFPSVTEFFGLFSDNGSVFGGGLKNVE